MKDQYPAISLSRLCRLLGITRQAYYQHFWSVSDISVEHHMIIQQIKQLRQLHPVMGCRKLYCLLQPFLLEHQIKIGRDALFDLLAANRLLVRKRRRRLFTTQSHHWLRKWPNLVKDFIPTAPNQLYVSDITYWKINSGYVYISFVTDAYSHKIVGYHVAPTLETVETICALKLALHSFEGCASQLIHHSDRGIQYCSDQYVRLLNQYQVKISMTEGGTPTDNAVAERVNGILKNEYLKHSVVNNIAEAKQSLDKSVKLYNEQRPHMGINMLTPQVVHQRRIEPQNLWKKSAKKQAL